MPLNNISSHHTTPNTSAKRIYPVVRIRVSISRPLKLVLIRRVIRRLGPLINLINTIIRTKYQNVNRRSISTTHPPNHRPRLPSTPPRFDLNMLRNIVPIMPVTPTRARSTRTLPSVSHVIRASTTAQLQFLMATIIITISMRSKNNNRIHRMFRVFFQRVATKRSGISTFRPLTSALIPRRFKQRVQSHGCFRSIFTPFFSVLKTLPIVTTFPLQCPSR